MSEKKKRLLWWGDGPSAATGFGTVSRNVLAAIHATGDWDITVRAINFYGQLVDFPYHIQPAGYPEPDPFGKKAFIRDLYTTPPFDLVVVNNDTYVVNDVADELAALAEKGYPARTIFYYPVDCALPPGMTKLIDTVTVPVAYSTFGHAETAKHTQRKVAIIPHGCEAIPRLTPDERRKFRRDAFAVDSDDTYVWVSVNRNSMRKDIARTIQAFSAFQAFQPDSRLYVHCQPQDNGLDMQAAAREAGVESKVAFPAQFSLSSGGMPRDMLMRVLQLADGFVTTHLGEGWGLTVTEAMAAGLPVVAPNNTTMPEILGGSYPYLYPCNDTVWVDNSGFRPRGLLRDIFSSMKRCSQERGTPQQAAAIEKSRKFTEQVSWEAVGKMWLQLIDHTMTLPTFTKKLAEAV